MKRNDWLNSLSNEELAFRMFGRGHFHTNCLDCPMYKSDQFGHWDCSNEDQSDDCESQFAEWLEEEME